MGHFNVFLGPKAELDFQDKIARALDLRTPNREVDPRERLRDRQQPTEARDGSESKGEGRPPQSRRPEGARLTRGWIIQKRSLG